MRFVIFKMQGPEPTAVIVREANHLVFCFRYRHRAIHIGVRDLIRAGDKRGVLMNVERRTEF